MKKKLLIAIIPIIILIIIAITLLILNLTTDLFKTPSELFWKYLAEVKEVTNILENDNFIEQNTLLLKACTSPFSQLRDLSSNLCCIV